MRLLPFALLLLLASACDNDCPPAWCEAQIPLTLDCTGPGCVAAVVVDYKRLDPRGYRVFSLSGTTPVDRKSAEAGALTYVQQVLKAPKPDSADTDLAGDFYLSFLRYDQTSDSWLVVTHGRSGEVLFAGLEDCATTKRNYDYPLPAGWTGPAALGCTRRVPDAQAKALRTTGEPIGTAPASTASQAWEVVRYLNLTEQFTAGTTYRVMVVSYAPATCEFDPWSSDWLVWITRDS